MKNPLVSILLPTYGRAKYIDEIIPILLKQTYKNIEIVITDDCSPDNTGEIVKKYNDARIKYIKREKNQGGYLNYYTTLCSDATGELAFYHADDDYITDENWLKEAVEIFENSENIGLVHSGYSFLNEAEKSKKDVVLNFPKIVSAKDFITRFSASDHMVHTFLFNREDVVKHIKKHIDWDQPYYTHMLESIFYSIINKNVGYINKSTMNYRLHASQQTKKESTVLEFTIPAVQTIKLFDSINRNFENTKEYVASKMLEFIDQAYGGHIDSFEQKSLRLYKICQEQLQSYDGKVVIFGAGAITAVLLEYFLKTGIKIDYIIDDNIKEICGYKTISFNEFKTLDIKRPKIILSSFSQKVIFKMLEKLFSSNLAFLNSDDLIAINRLW